MKFPVHQKTIIQLKGLGTKFIHFCQIFSFHLLERNFNTSGSWHLTRVTFVYVNLSMGVHKRKIYIYYSSFRKLKWLCNVIINNKQSGSIICIDPIWKVQWDKDGILDTIWWSYGNMHIRFMVTIGISNENSSTYHNVCLYIMEVVFRVENNCWNFLPKWVNKCQHASKEVLSISPYL